VEDFAAVALLSADEVELVVELTLGGEGEEVRADAVL
jgi:hypothetical protein